MTTPTDPDPTCENVGERLLEFRDGSLPPAEHEWLRQHLHACPNCLTLLDSYDQAVEVVQRLQPVDIPEGMMERVRLRLEGRGGGRGGGAGPA